MTAQKTWAGILVTLGFAAMLIGAIDPLEGSLLVVPGSGLVALGIFLRNGERSVKIYRLWVFVLITFGVAALWWLSMAGGFGGSSGLSIWWGVLILPYLVGWVMGILGADSPRWVLWLGLVVGCWYVAIPVLMGVLPLESPQDVAASINIVQIVIGLTGVLTIGGSIYQLRKASTVPES